MQCRVHFAMSGIQTQNYHDHAPSNSLRVAYSLIYYNSIINNKNNIKETLKSDGQQNEPVISNL
jgi:hypothetical protein